MLGVPLLRQLTLNELRGAIAHECGHYHDSATPIHRAHYQNYLWFDGFREAFRYSWSFLKNPHEDGGPAASVARLTTVFVQWIVSGVYTPYLGVMGYLLRNAEFEIYCDSVGAKLVGGQTYASVLRKIGDIEIAFDEAVTQNMDVGEFIAFVDGTCKWIRENNPPIRKVVLEAASATHPSLSQRIQRAKSAPGVPDSSGPAMTDAATKAFWSSLYGLGRGLYRRA